MTKADKKRTLLITFELGVRSRHEEVDARPRMDKLLPAHTTSARNTHALRECLTRVIMSYNTRSSSAILDGSSREAGVSEALSTVVRAASESEVFAREESIVGSQSPVTIQE